MPAKAGAGRLVEMVGFEQPQAGSDGAGGVLDGFAEQFETRAQFIHLRGGESVLAARLEGRHTLVIRVRSSAASRAVNTDWRIADKRAGTLFNIRDITPSEDRAWLDFLCESGVAA